MMFLGPPYLSEQLKQTVLSHQFPIVSTFDFKTDADLKPYQVAYSEIEKTYLKNKRILCNYPTALEQIARYLPSSRENHLATLFIDKSLFRNHLSKHYPDFSYVILKKNTLAQQTHSPIGLPCVIKPNRYWRKSTFICYDQADWIHAIESISSTKDQSSYRLLTKIYNDDIILWKN